MTKIVGIRFQQAGKIYSFDPLDYALETGMHVIVETARGVEMGTVLIPVREVDDGSVPQPLKPVMRIATEEDEKTVESNHQKEKEAYAICKEKIAKHGLEMKLVAAEYTFDNNKLLFYFTADGRIDFRELVKDLASVFRTRIELRQIGVRDETKMLGGIGICGRELCCKAYLTDFIPVSIKMAKEQNLSLNPTKISGVCGRLMCCLKNEEETYEYLNSRLPAVGDTVTTPSGMRGEVMGINVLRQQVKVVVDNGEEKELQEYSVDDLTFTPRRRKAVKLTEEEIKELEGLEDSSENAESKPQIVDNREAAGEDEGNRDRNDHQDSGRENRRDFNRDNRGRQRRDNRDNRGNRENRENRGNRDYRGSRDYRANRDNDENRDNRGNRENGENGENREKRESRDNRDFRNGNRNRENRGGRGRRSYNNYDRKNHQDGSDNSQQ